MRFINPIQFICDTNRYINIKCQHGTTMQTVKTSNAIKVPTGNQGRDNPCSEWELAKLNWESDRHNISLVENEMHKQLPVTTQYLNSTKY